MLGSTNPAAWAASAWVRHRPWAQQPAHHAAELPRPLRHRRGLRLAVFAGDRSGSGADRARSPIRVSSAWTTRRCRLPEKFSANRKMLVPPLEPEEARKVELVKGSNISTLPDFEPLPDDIDLEVLLKVGDNVSTDEIMPAGSRSCRTGRTFRRSPSSSTSRSIDTYATRAAEHEGGHAIVGGENYGQGSSREHAVIAPRYLGPSSGRGEVVGADPLAESRELRCPRSRVHR